MKLIIKEKSFIGDSVQEKLINSDYINYFSKKHSIISYKEDYILVSDAESLINSDLFIKVKEKNGNFNYLISPKNIRETKVVDHGLYIYFNSIFAELFFKKGTDEYNLLINSLNLIK